MCHPPYASPHAFHGADETRTPVASRELPLLVGRRRLPVTRPRFWGCRHSIRRYSSKQCTPSHGPRCSFHFHFHFRFCRGFEFHTRAPCPVPAVRSFRSLRLRLYTGSLSALALALLHPLSSSRVTAAVDVVLSFSRSLALAFLHRIRIRTRARALPAPGLPSNRTSSREDSVLRLCSGDCTCLSRLSKSQPRGHRTKIKI